MTLTVKHTFTSAIPDDPTAASAGEVLPSHWNANHTITGQVDLSTDVTGALPATSVSGALSNCNAFTGDSGSGGSKGLVPAPSSGDASSGKYLKADGTWEVPPGSGGGGGGGPVDLTSDVVNILPAANGGTGNGFANFSGPSSSVKTFTLPNSNATLLSNQASSHGSISGTEHVALTDSTYTTTQAIADLAFTGTSLSGLTAASTLIGPELFYAVQSGSDTKVTATQIADFASATFAAGSGFLSSTTADQTLSGGANVTTYDNGTKSSGTFSFDCGKCPLQKAVNGGAFTLAAPGQDGSAMLMVTNNSSAGAITFSGFTVGTNTGDAMDTTNTHVFTISIWRINGVSGYRVAAHQ